ncbi:MAG: hypothetical protein K2J40_10400 [Ruminococcus sp.]|nr:hypothetical protein [Ruminococcus sp.]
MKELTDDIFYKYIEKYDKCLLDYVILSADEDYKGEVSHKEAVITAVSALNSRKRVGNMINPPEFYVDESKMRCEKCDTENFFIISPKRMVYHDWTYSDVFLNSDCMPYSVPYTAEDFRKVNHLLFPACYRKDLEIYSWNDGFSNYFDYGNDCLGAIMWSIYDRHMMRFVIIGSSITD